MKRSAKKHKKLSIFLITFIALIAVALTGIFIIYNMAYHKVTIECGASASASDFMKNGDANASFVQEDLDIATLLPGDYTISVKSGIFIHKINVCISDTTAPTGDVVSMYTSIGEPLGAECFVQNVIDATPVTVAYASTPDYNSVHEENVGIVLTDTSGNTNQLTSRLTVVPFKTKLTVEAGSKQLTIADFKLDNSDITAVTALEDIALDTVGDSTVSILYNEKMYDSTVSVVDTVAPTVSFKSIDGYIGVSYQPEDFVVKANDETSLTYSFNGDVSYESYETQNISISVTDEGGNTVTGEVSLKLIDDTEPPVLEGVHDIYVYQGNSVSYKDGITVSDNCVEGLSFEVDTKNVDTDVVGTYPVTYTVTDVAGHSVSASCNVIVQERTYDMDEINAAADELLASILTDDMTDRDKAWAIYAYIRGHMYFIDDYDEGSYIKACYDGVIGWKGDCYVYACTAQTLLTRAGIKNMMISKIPTRRHHYWNIVDVDGTGYYHYDTTPRAEENHPTFFLWTDAQMMEYSHNHYNCFNYDRTLYPEIN